MQIKTYTHFSRQKFLSMSDPYWYFKDDASTISSNEDALTPSTATLYAVNTNQPASSVALQHRSEPIPSPEPTVLLVEIQRAVEDVTQAVGQFGPKMTAKLRSPHIKAALFEDRKLLRLSSLEYIDSFTCQLTELYKKPISLKGEAPLLWWLWEPLLEFLEPSGFSVGGFTLDFASVHNTDVTLPYKISIKVRSNSNGNGEKEIEMTAAYGGVFKERRVFIAPIKTFRFQKQGFGKTTVPLAIDKSPYTGDSDYSDMLDYLMPHPRSIWCSAMKVPEKAEVYIVTAFADTCKADDDIVCVTNDQDLQCKNFLQRLQPAAREFIQNGELVGKKGGSFSIRANGPPGHKD
jgi:hypothetical protein